MITNEQLNQLLEKLKPNHFIAFGFNYNGGTPNEIIVAPITSIERETVLVHFSYGHHSLGEFVRKEDIIAIADAMADDKIKGWTGKYRILKPDHPLLNDLI